jgi:hypothetical protein
MDTSERPEAAVAHPPAATDIRHLVCGDPARLQRNQSYREARTRVLAETAAGERSRIVLVTNRSNAEPGMALDVPLEILPVFGAAVPGQPARIDRAILDCLYSSARGNTVFLIYETGHPILAFVERGMRERGIAFRRSRPDP